MNIRPTIDINLQVVVEWVNNDTGERISVPRDEWKHYSNWSYQEILELFGEEDTLVEE